METKVLIDTHVALWLLEGAVDLLTERAKKILNSSEVNISPISLLELSLLFEIQRVKLPPEEVIQILQDSINLKILDDSFEVINRAAIGVKWTRDPFDRLIVSQAKIRNMKLITKDRQILENYTHATW